MFDVVPGTPSSAMAGRPSDVQWALCASRSAAAGTTFHQVGNLETGIKVIDVLVPLDARQGGTFWRSGVGKTVLLTEMIHNMIKHQAGVSIFCGIGERCREGEELYRDMKEAGVLPNMVMVFGQNERAARQPVPGGSCRADDGRVFPRRRAPRCAAAHRQYLPFPSRPAWRCPA